MENIIIGPPLEQNFWDELNLNLGNYILEYIRNTEDRVILINAETGQELKLSELAEQSINLSAHLQTLGCKDGVTAAIYSENTSIEFMITFMGISLTGATVATFNYMYTLDELYYGISLVQPKLIFCTQGNTKKAKEAQKLYTCIEKIVVLNPHESQDTTTLKLQNLLQKPHTKLVHSPYNANATAAILFSSGTTGLPKGVMQSQRNILYVLKMFKTYDLFHFDGKISLSTVPMRRHLRYVKPPEGCIRRVSKSRKNRKIRY